MNRIEHIEIWYSETGWTKRIIDANKYPNLCSLLFADYKSTTITPMQYLTFIPRLGTSIYIKPERYLNGTNYCWQILGYKSSGLYGDNGEFPTYIDALQAAIEFSLQIVEDIINEVAHDDHFFFDTVLEISTPEEVEQRKKESAEWLANFKTTGSWRKNRTT